MALVLTAEPDFLLAPPVTFSPLISPPWIGWMDGVLGWGSLATGHARLYGNIPMDGNFQVGTPWKARECIPIGTSASRWPRAWRDNGALPVCFTKKGGG
jgi:hypothetical protein